MIVKKRRLEKAILVCLLIVFASIGMTACGSSNSIVGTWVAEDNDDMLKFNDNGLCSVPFSYNGAWMESANNFAVKEDGTLVLSSPSGHADDSYEKTEDEEEALDDSSKYYLSGDTLIIEKDKYTRTK